MSIFSDCLNEIRQNHQLKIVDLARICELDTSVVYRWCYGERTPSSYSIITLLSQKILLSIQERKKLEHAYMQTIWGLETYQHYLGIEELLKFLYTECHSDHFQPKTMKQNSKLYRKKHSASTPYYHLLENHHSIISETYKLLHYINPNVTTYIKIHEPFDEFLFMLLHHILIFGPQKMEILLCISENIDFYKSEKLSYLKAISEIFLYNTDAQIMLYSEPYTEMHDSINWIITDEYCLQYNRTIQLGSITNYPEWIQNTLFHFSYLKSTAKLLGSKTDSTYGLVDNTKQIHKISIYGFLPHLSFMAQSSINVCSENDIRNFMESGNLPKFNHSPEDLLSMEQRKNTLKQILHRIANEQSAYYLLKNGSLSSSILLELYEGDQLETVKVNILEENGTNHEINFYDQEILQSFNSYFDVIKHPKNCYTKEESEERIRKILEEY